jgi:hypothetical protein
MMRIDTNLLALAGVVLLGCSSSAPKPPPPPVAISELAVGKVTADLSVPDADAAYWRNRPEGIVTLMAQPMIAPRPEATTTEQVFVKAVTDGERAAFRIRWKDPERSEAGRLGEFSDALALEFPVHLDPLPPVMMGAKDMPVHIFHWRAQYQRDHERGKPSMTDLYPNNSIDMYPLEFKEAPDGTEAHREAFSPGVAEGNPQSYVKTGIDEIIAEGYSTSSVQLGHGNAGKAEWKDGWWTLVIVRPLVIEGGSTLKSGETNYVGFAAWQGGLAEVASRKCVTMSWMPVTLP